VTVPPENSRSPVTALISPKGLGGVPLFAAKVIEALMLSRLVPLFSTLACVPPLSNRLSIDPPELLNDHGLLPVKLN